MTSLARKALALQMALAAAFTPRLDAQRPTDRVHHLFADWREERRRLEPELATRVGRTESDDRWRDWPSTGVARVHASRVRFRNELDHFEPASRLADDTRSLALLRGDLDRRLAGEDLDT
jgi:hypothetical protein